MFDADVQSKRTQRRLLRARRALLPGPQRRRASRALACRAGRLRWFHRARRIACYLAQDGEIDCGPLIALIRRRRRICYLPVLVTWPRGALRFAAFPVHCVLRPNRLGVPEPRVPRSRLLVPARLDLIFSPLVGFDADGRRLGMGGGFYDRALGVAARRSRYVRPVAVGLAYEIQRLERIVDDPWDVPLAAVVTEQSVYDPSRPAVPA